MVDGEDVCTTPGGDASTASVRSCARKVMGPSLLRRPRGMPSQLVRFQVDLEGQNRVYFAGEELNGHVHVHLNEDLPIQGIILRIVGEAYVNVADEPRPWTAAKRRLKRPFKSMKISPSTLSEPSDIKESFFFRSSELNWETATTTTMVSAQRSQRSTLQRDQPLSIQPVRSRKLKKNGEDLRFRAHEKYFEHKIYVFGHRYSSTRELMWKGEHSFPFSYILPSKLPVSFHGRFGYVRFFCEASLERHNHPTVQRRAFFSVSSTMDLNADSKADSGVNKEKKTNSWCFCCPSGTIIVSAKIKKRGFVPGEMIPLQAYVFNVSNKPVHRITAKIIQIVTYFSSKGFQKRIDETVICERSEGTLPPGESTSWDEYGPCVPPCPPSSNMIDCKLITIDYRLEFVLDIPKAKEPLTLRMPIRIGTIPLEKTFKNLMDPVEALDFGENRSSFPPSVCSKYPKLPAVFCLKCVKGDRNVNRYYFKQIPRSMQSMLGISARLPTQPVITDDDEVYAPRYLTYMMCPEKLKNVEEDLGEFKPRNAVKITQNGTAAAGANHLVINGSPPRGRKQAMGVTSITSNGPDRPISVISNFPDGGTSIINSSPEGATALLRNGAEESNALSNGCSPIKTPSSLCSPTSFRSRESGRKSLVQKLDRLVKVGSWEGSPEGLRKRSESTFAVKEMKANFDESLDPKKEKQE